MKGAVIRWMPIVANVVLFDLLWTAAVLGAGRPWWWAAPALITVSAAAQLHWSPAPLLESSVILIGAATGVMLDVASHALGLFRYASSSSAEFIIVFLSLWINFGTTLRPSIRWVWRRPLIAAALGGLGGPLAYLVAARIGAIAPIEPTWRAFAWCGVQYAVALPLWGLAASIALTAAPRSTRPSTPTASPQPPGTTAS